MTLALHLHEVILRHLRKALTPISEMHKMKKEEFREVRMNDAQALDLSFKNKDLAENKYFPGLQIRISSTKTHITMTSMDI